MGGTAYCELGPPTSRKITIINEEKPPQAILAGGGDIFSNEAPSAKRTLACVRLT